MPCKILTKWHAADTALEAVVAEHWKVELTMLTAFCQARV